MDCPSEENLIRMKLEGHSSIQKLDFKIDKRELTVYHNEDDHSILDSLDTLDLDTQLISTVDSSEEIIDDRKNQSKLLWQVLIINFSFFIIELITGFFSKSMGLVADSLDMLADSFVYALGLFAVGGSLIRKRNVAKTAGYFQILLAVIGFGEVIHRFISSTDIPEYKTMIVISFLALIANGICLILLQKSKSDEAHMKASMIFTSNDVIINLGVILAGSLVYLLNSPYPDLIIGSIVFIVVTRGATRILKLG